MTNYQTPGYEVTVVPSETTGTYVARIWRDCTLLVKARGRTPAEALAEARRSVRYLRRNGEL